MSGEGAGPAPDLERQTILGGRVDAIILAAGRSSRMGGPNKLLACFEGKPLVRRLAERALGSKARSVRVVTGHQAERLTDALRGLDIRFVANPHYAQGLATSLKAGIAALPIETAGALVLLADMPEIEARHLDLLIAAFAMSDGAQIVRASHQGEPGNPVLLPRAVFPAVMDLVGDAGARQIIASVGLKVNNVEIGAGAMVDVDTADAMAAVGGILQG